MWDPRCQVESDRHPLQASQSTCHHVPEQNQCKNGEDDLNCTLQSHIGQLSVELTSTVASREAWGRGEVISGLRSAWPARAGQWGGSLPQGCRSQDTANTTGPQQTPRSYNPRCTHRADVNPPKYIHPYKLLFPAQSCGIYCNHNNLVLVKMDGVYA